MVFSLVLATVTHTDRLMRKRRALLPLMQDLHQTDVELCSQKNFITPRGPNLQNMSKQPLSTRTLS